MHPQEEFDGSRPISWVPAKMIVRPATLDDVSAILAIYNEAVLNTVATADYEPHTLQQRIAWYNDRTKNGYPIFVAEDETGRVVGWSAYGPYHSRMGYRYSVENSVYVAADMRGKGIGKLLLPALIETARERGVHSIVASIDGSNEASIRLHTAFGFKQAGRLQQVYTKFGRWLDVVYMQLILNSE